MKVNYAVLCCATGGCFLSIFNFFPTTIINKRMIGKTKEKYAKNSEISIRDWKVFGSHASMFKNI